MRTRPTQYRPQTLRQAKAAYRKYGQRISSQEQRQLERGAELLRREEAIREKERKKRLAAKKRQEKETREREARRQSARILNPVVTASQPAISCFMNVGKPQVQKNGNFTKYECAEAQKQDEWSDELDDDSLLKALTSVSSGRPDDNASVASQSAQGSGITTNANDGSKPHFASMTDDPMLLCLSTQDIQFSIDDIQDAPKPLTEVQANTTSEENLQRTQLDRKHMPPPRLPPTQSATALNNRVHCGRENMDFCLSTQDLKDISS